MAANGLLKYHHNSILKRHFLKWIYGVLLTGFLFPVFNGSLLAQPCLSGWTYRVPVTVTNPGTTETNLPVSITFNSRDLVVSGKLRFDGADLRVLDDAGNSLSFWFDPEEMNTSSTELWVKIPTLAPGSSIIYLYYGNSAAQTANNGEAVFGLFDDFDNASVNTSTWDVCGASNASIDNGQLVFNNALATPEMSALRSVDAFSSDVIIETGITKVSGTGVFAGLVSTSDEGYALYYDSASLKTMKLQVIQPDVSCVDLIDQIPTANRENANAIFGQWSLRWPASNEQYLDWPGAPSRPLTRNDVTYSLPASYHAIVGLEGAESSANFDWVRVRKYTDSNITTLLGTEDVISINASITTNAPVCEGSDISLSATNFDGASYSWTGPGGFTASGQYIEINNASTSDSGLYEVTITGSGGCGIITTLKEVNVFAVTNTGTISGTTQQCVLANTGTISLSGITGDVLRWESSLSGETPWNTISSEETSLDYENLNTTTHYRAIIQNGVCAAEASDIAKITIFEPSNGGYIIGAGEVCAEENTSTVTAFGHNGNILAWEYSQDNFATITTVNSTNEEIIIEDLGESVQVRSIVKNGACPQAYSLPSTIKVNPLPSPNFVADTVCNGWGTNFTNLSSIGEGIISSYSWNFGDGASSVNEDPVHTYKNDGVYQVKLLAISGKNCIDSVKKSIRINPLPVPDFYFENSCEDIAVPFENNSFINSGSITNYQWDFADGNNSAAFEPTHTYVDAGEYAVKLVLESSEGCQDSLSKVISVFGRSNVEFTADSVCDGLPVQFINNSTSSSGNLSFTWNFGDGSTSTSLNPNHLFDTPGSYLVRLTANSTSSCMDSFEKIVNVHPQPIADFSVNDICLNDTAIFVNNSTISSGQLSYSWTFGDGGFSNTTAPKYVYNVPGIYQSTLTARSDKGCSHSTDVSLEVFDRPSSKFVVQPVCNGENSVFQNLSETGKFDATYLWDFGDGNISEGSNPIHEYDMHGEYDVRLVTTSDAGCSDTINNLATVWALPQSDFIAEPVCDGFPTTFVNNSAIVEGEIKSYSWDFGDGTNSVQTAPVKQYLNAGSYPVQLRAISKKGCENVFEDIVLVKETPIANFTFMNVCEGEPVLLENTSQFSGGSAEYVWDFGNGESSTIRSPEYTFEQPGNFAVELKIEVNQCQDSITKVVNTYAIPFTTISNDTTISKGFSVKLNASGGTKYFWEPITGLDNSDIPDPVASPSETTTYTAYVIDGNGCRVSRQVTVHINDDYIIRPSNVLTPDGNGQNDTWKVNNIENYPDNEVFVYNRWGQEVFSTTGYQNDWGGLSGADLLPDGTYYYLIVFKESELKYSGALTILRNKQ